MVLTSKLIDGTFPDYTRVIPTGNDKLLRVDPKSFFEGVDRVATIATEKTRAVKMAVEADKVTLSVTSPTTAMRRKNWPPNMPRKGSRSASTPIISRTSSARSTATRVEIHLADAGAPTLIRQDEKSPALYVLMPMRV